MRNEMSTVCGGNAFTSDSVPLTIILPGLTVGAPFAQQAPKWIHMHARDALP